MQKSDLLVKLATDKRVDLAAASFVSLNDDGTVFHYDGSTEREFSNSEKFVAWFYDAVDVKRTEAYHVGEAHKDGTLTFIDKSYDLKELDFDPPGALFTHPVEVGVI